MNWKLQGGIAVGSFVAGFLVAYYVRGQQTAEAIGQADAYHEQLTAAQDSVAEAKVLQADADSRAEALQVQANAEIAAANARRVQAEQRSDAAAARRPGVIERVVREAGVDSSVVRVAVQTVADSIVQNEVVPLRVALAESLKASAAKDLRLAAKDEQIATRDRVQAGLETALAISQKEAGALRGALPGWAARNWSKVAIPAAVAGGWYLRGALQR